MAAMITRLFKRVGSTVRSIRDNLADSSDSDVEAEAGPPEPSSMALPSDRGVSRLERFALLWEAPQVSEAELQSLCWLGIPDLYRAPCWQLLLVRWAGVWCMGRCTIEPRRCFAASACVCSRRFFARDTVFFVFVFFYAHAVMADEHFVRACVC